MEDGGETRVTGQTGQTDETEEIAHTGVTVQTGDI
jgi:hypothetical protein